MSKLDKFRRDPALFFRDSSSPLARRTGKITSGLWRRSLVRNLLLDPGRALANEGIPAISRVARAIEGRAAARRQTAIGAAGTPRVSVIMAAHDAAETIDGAIASVLAQTYERLELIVVDDGSADDTLAIARRWSERDARVTAVANPENQGAAMARNRGLSLATGDLVAFQDADDVSDPERLERQVAPLCNSSAILSVCNAERNDETGRRLEVNGRAFTKTPISMVFRREPVLERIGYLRAMRVSEDAEYYERIKAAFGPGAEIVIHAPLLAQRFSPGSLLFSDGATERIGHRVSHRRSAEADRAWSEALAAIERIRAGLEDPYVAYDPGEPAA